LAIIGLIFSGMVVALALHAADFGFAEVYNTDRLLDRFAD